MGLLALGISRAQSHAVTLISGEESEISEKQVVVRRQQNCSNWGERWVFKVNLQDSLSLKGKAIMAETRMRQL